MINRFQKTALFLFSICFASSIFNPSYASSDERYMPMSLAISGGISLGSYEAGLNWAIVKQLKIARDKPEKRIDQYQPSIRAIAGASAGGINALVSAIAWCLDDKKIDGQVSDVINNNLFRDIWLGVGFDNLLPEDANKYEPTDGLLSRKAFDSVINQIRVLLDKKIFRNDCHIPVALTVTRTTPIVMNVDGIKVRNQRFVIPFFLSSDENNPGKIKLISYRVEKDSSLFGNVIYLQAMPGTKILLDIDAVIKAVLATSAFPVAFGKMKLDYCIKRTLISSYGDDESTDLRCPVGHVMQSDYFVDGGVFDNVPLGLAKAMTETESIANNIKYNYIYLDPASRRPYRLEFQKNSEEDDSFGLKSQLSFISGAIKTGEQYELYNVLRSSDWSGNGPRKILLTSRHPPITGEFLAHFGAFIDSSFREYDYYAGVYDAVHNIASYRCYRRSKSHAASSDCLSNEAKVVYQNLFDADDTAAVLAKSLFALLAKHEHSNELETHIWQWAWQGVSIDESITNNTLLVAKTILSIKPKAEDPTLEELIAKLPTTFDTQHAGFMIKRILKYKHQSPSKWFYPLASRASIRLLDLEQQEQRLTGDSLQGLVGGGAFAIESTLGDKKDFVWNQSTGKNDWFKLLPHEINYDLANTGWSAAWEPRWQMSKMWGLNTKLTPYAVQRSSGERRVFNQLDVFISHDISGSAISSWGVGPSYVRLRDKEQGLDQTNYGYAAYLGFFGDKLRLTAGNRAESGGLNGDEFYLYLGVTDIPGFSYWVNRTFR